MSVGNDDLTPSDEVPMALFQLQRAARLADLVALAKGVVAGAAGLPCDVLVCPPFVWLAGWGAGSFFWR